MSNRKERKKLSQGFPNCQERFIQADLAWGREVEGFDFLRLSRFLSVMLRCRSVSQLLQNPWKGSQEILSAVSLKA